MYPQVNEEQENACLQYLDLIELLHENTFSNISGTCGMRSCIQICIYRLYTVYKIERLVCSVDYS